MGLLLVRHADAVTATGGLADTDRWLTPEGRTRAAQSARLLGERGVAFQHCVTSPRVRAVQTAEIFARVLSFEGPVRVVPSLSFTCPARDAARELAAIEGNVLAVGHMPTLAEIAQILCSGERLRSLDTAEGLWINAGKVVWTIEAGLRD